MGDFKDFFQTGQLIIEDLASQNRSFLIIGTRSILVLLGNVLLGRTPNIGGGYVEIKWENCGILAFEIMESRFKKLDWSNIYC